MAKSNLKNYIGAGLAADRPVAATIAADLYEDMTAFYFATDTDTLSMLDPSVPVWLDQAVPAGTFGNLAYLNASAFVQTLLDDADPPAFRVSIGAQQSNSNLDLYASGDVPSGFTLSIIDNPDASTWRNALGAVNVAGDTMTGALTVPGFEIITSTANINFRRYSSASAASPSTLALIRGRGTSLAPLAVLTGDTIFELQARAVHTDASTASVVSGLFRFVLTDTSPGPTRMGGSFRVNLCADGASSTTEVIRAEPATGLSMFGANTVIDSNRNFRARPYTVATLPTVGTADRICAVTDALAPAWNTALVGGGAIRTLAYDNGTAWTAH